MASIPYHVPSDHCTTKTQIAAFLCEHDTDISIEARSCACELVAQRLAARLGTPEAALERFGASQSSPLQTSAPTEPDQASSLYAAGSDDNPIMLSNVKVRSRPHRLICQNLYTCLL